MYYYDEKQLYQVKRNFFLYFRWFYITLSSLLMEHYFLNN